MAITTINVGNLVNDGLGDDLRTAFQKVNANFAELEAGITVTASNLGAGGEGIFKQKTGVNLEFKKLIAGRKIEIDSGANVNALVLNNSADDAFTSITADTGVIVASIDANTTDLTIRGGQDVVVSAAGSTVTVDTKLDLNRLLLTYDFGPIAGDFETPLQMAMAAANIDFGLITQEGRLALDLGTI